MFIFAEGFGVNTNILETNVLNLAVVIGVLIYFGGDVLNSILSTRNETILARFNEVNQRLEDSKRELAQADQEYTKAISDANSIRTKNEALLSQQVTFSIISMKAEIDRMTASQEVLIQLEEGSMNRKIRKEIIENAYQRTIDKLQQRLSNQRLKRQVFDIGLSVLTNI